MAESSNTDYLAPIKEASDRVKDIVLKVLALESERLYQERPRVQDDITRIVKDAVAKDLEQ